MNRVVLLTGVTGRLGTDFCKRYSNDYTIVGVARKGDKPEGCTHIIHADISKDWESVVSETLQLFKKVDVLINNAATYHIKDMRSLAPDEMLHVLNINVVAPYALARECYLKFWHDKPDRNVKFKRRVINISSVSAKTAYENQIAYGTSKAALSHLNEHLTNQLKECKVRSHIVYPNGFPNPVPTEKVTDFVVGLDRETVTFKDHWEIQHEKPSK